MKKIFFCLIFIIWIFYFILSPKAAFDASAAGLLLWFYQIVPALLPYAILSSVIIGSNLLETLKQSSLSGKHRSRISCFEWFVILCGFLFGFPIGSKLSSDLCEQGFISKKRAQVLCAFTNNMSSVFVSSFVLTSQLHMPEWILPTYLILYGIPLTYGILRLFFMKQETFDVLPRKKPASRFQLNMQIVDAGILSSFDTLIRLCGYIVMFSITAGIISSLRLPADWIKAVATGILEITNGTVLLAESQLPDFIKYLLAIAFLSFGGISGIAQTGSMIQKSGLSTSSYIKSKLLLVCMTTLTAFLYILLRSGSLHIG